MSFAPGDRVVWTDPTDGRESGGEVVAGDPAEVLVKLWYCSVWTQPADLRLATARDGLCFMRPQPR